MKKLLRRSNFESVEARSVHHIMKVVAGVPLRRRPWFFDNAVYGEALADVGTHVVDLVQWVALADQSLDYRRDVQLLEGRRWPLMISPQQFQQVTGEPRPDTLEYFCNNSVHYKLRGIDVKIEVLWHWEAPAGSGDVYEASFRGTKARADIRLGDELFIVPASPLVRRKVAALASRWPGLSVVESAGEARIVIPDEYRVGHEAHFGQVAQQFFAHLKSPRSAPSWERPNMLAKYYVTTLGSELGKP